MSAPAPILIEAESRAVRRGVPDPRIRLPMVAWPTIALFVAGAAVWAFGAWLLLAQGAAGWVTIPLLAAVSFTMFTVLHECVHHAAGRLTWVNEVFGRASAPFFGAPGTFAGFRFLHIEHHQHTNENLDIDPDMWISHGPKWQLPFRWALLDVGYMVFYFKRIKTRPLAEKIEVYGVLAAFTVVMIGCIATGHGWEFFAMVWLPQRLGMTAITWWFGWLPHHDLNTTAAQDNFRTTRTRIGLEWLLTPLMLYQNYHSVHHLHPSIPFYRYIDAWKRNEQVYLDRNVPLATVWGRELSASEYRAWRGLTDSYSADSAPEPTAPVGPGEFHRLTVSEVRPLTPDAVSITFDIPQHLRDQFRFTAGQHVVVRHEVDGQELRRTYSICTSAASGMVRIAVRRLPDGRMSGFLNTVTPGQVLQVSTPRGRFTLKPDPNARRHYVGIAAGSGITPLISMLATALSLEEQSRFTLLYGNRTAESTMFRDELQMLVRQFEGRLQIVEFRDGEQVTAPGAEAGPITADYLNRRLAGDLAPARVDGWYLCGPEQLVRTVKDVLAGYGVEPHMVHSELFIAAAATATVTGDDIACVLTAVVGSEEVTITTTPGQTVLAALLNNGVPAPYSCMGGACGTCRARITHGCADMDQNQALERHEVAAGYVLTCQARPRTTRLDADFNS
jgi:ferredoxin-NADP reductase/fatty acid desaturase